MGQINFDRLFKLRLIVARFGEMDCARWWNTQGVLGRYGALALGRGFPKTHRFAQAKIAFAVAAQRCREIYDPPDAFTLWSLSPEIEDRFQEKWHDWLENMQKWESFFKGIEDVAGQDLLKVISQRELISPEQMEVVGKLRRSAEGRSVQISGASVLDDSAAALLAAGFFKGEPGKPAIPFLNKQDTKNEN